MRKLKVRFRIVPSRVSEASREKNPRRLVIELAVRKALSVARKHPRALVLGADTVVYAAGRILVKPRDHADSMRLLRSLNGRWHRVYTGVAVAAEGGRRIVSQAVATKVRARKLTDAELERLAGKHMDKAGAYAIQDHDDPLIDRIVGDRDNVIGLPVKAVGRLLKKARRSLDAAASPRRL